jgi:hypothetical protein
LDLIQSSNHSARTLARILGRILARILGTILARTPARILAAGNGIIPYCFVIDWGRIFISMFLLSLHGYLF